MCVLFDKVQIYMQKSEFTLACYVQEVPKHPVILREPHQFTEILIINVDENTSVIHGSLDKLLLNATTVSDFKKALPKKHTIQ